MLLIRQSLVLSQCRVNLTIWALNYSRSVSSELIGSLSFIMSFQQQGLKLNHTQATKICRAHPLTVNTLDLPSLDLFSIWLLGYDVKIGSWSGIYVFCMLLFLKT